MSINTCDNKCCNYLISDYKCPVWLEEDWDKWRSENESSNRIKKSGAFIVDPSTKKILLVQSRGQFWGPPKGSLNKEEDVMIGAIREVKEETGIILNSKQLDKFYVVKGRALYYYLELKEEPIKIQSHIKDNDANGIGWFNLECLPTLIKDGKITINRHTKILIKKFFGIEI